MNDTETEKLLAEEADTVFDFFNILPNSQLIVKKNTALGDKETAYVYYLQAGSFMVLADAEQRRARIALLGFSANIEAFSDEDLTWHRVQVGPFYPSSQACRCQKPVNTRKYRFFGAETHSRARKMKLKLI